jgi:hypothetical protein
MDEALCVTLRGLLPASSSAVDGATRMSCTQAPPVSGLF